MPFLDHELVELAARIPPEEKLRDGGKGILKDVARKVVPSIDRKKGYFPVPQLKYIDGPYLDMLRDALSYFSNAIILNACLQNRPHRRLSEIAP